MQIVLCGCFNNKKTNKMKVKGAFPTGSGISVGAEARLEVVLCREWGPRRTAGRQARCEARGAGLEVKDAFQDSSKNMSPAPTLQLT